MSNLKNVRAELEKMRKEMAAKEAELRREEARPVIELVNNELMNSEDVLEKFAGYSKDEARVIAKHIVMNMDNHYQHFSPFVRDQLLMTDDKQLTAKEWFSFWRNQKLEQIGRDVHEVMIVARANNQVTQEHVSILLGCVQDLISEVNQTQ